MLIGYARVSTEDQDLASQTHALTQAGVHPAAIFSEHESGRAQALPQLEAAITKLQKGDWLVVVDLDRLTRRGPAALHNLLARVAERGAKVRALRQAWCDPDSPFYELLVSVTAWFAEREVQQIRTRTNEGVKAAKARGVQFGRRKSLTQTQIELARGMIQDGRPKSEIAQILRVHRTTLTRNLAKMEGE